MAKEDWESGDIVDETALNLLGTEISDATETNIEQETELASISSLDKTIAASCRSLLGVRSDITSSFQTGAYDTTGMTVTGWASAAGKFRYVGCVPSSYAPSGGTLCVNNNPFEGSEAVGGYQSIVNEFLTDADEVRVYFYTANQKQDFWAIVDDMLIANPGNYFHTPDANNFATWKLEKSAGGWSKWRIHGTQTFNGIGIPSGAKIVPTTPGFQLGVMGDSWVQGSLVNNAVSPGVAGTITAGTLFGKMEQLTGLDVWRFGIGSTGYVAQGSNGADGPFGSVTRMAALAAAPALDAILIGGSLNDGAETSGAIVAAAQATWAAIKEAQPTARLIVAGMQPIRPTDSTITTLNTALINAAQAHSDVDAVIDWRTRSFITGTGYDGSPQNDGNGDVVMGTDNLHFTHVGHDWAGAEITRMIKEIVV